MRPVSEHVFIVADSAAEFDKIRHAAADALGRDVSATRIPLKYVEHMLTCVEEIGALVDADRKQAEKNTREEILGYPPVDW